MSAAQLQTPAPVQGRAHHAVSLFPQLPLTDPFAGVSTPLRQQSGGSAIGLPARPQQPPPAARVLSFGASSPAAGPVTMAEPDQQLELSEEALFQEDQDGQDAAADAMSSESEDEAEPAKAARTPPAAAAEADSSDSSDEEISDEFAQAAELHRSASSGALTGAQLHVSFDTAAPSTPASAGGSVPAQTPGSAPGSERPIAAFNGSGSPAPPRRPVSTIPTPVARKKMAVDSTASKLGTSVPIAIPMGPRDERESTPESPEEPGGIHAATFVPPHMLESMRSGGLDMTNSVQGTSPAASLKRERLQNRNAILRRTGFLEGSHGAAFLETLDPIARAMDPIRESFEAPPMPAPAPVAVPGALSRALGAAGSAGSV